MFASCVSLYIGFSKLLELGIRASLIMLCLLGSLIIGVATHNSFTAMGQTWLIFYYVDEIILTASSYALQCSITDLLSSKFSMKNLGPLNYFLGIG